MRKSDIVMGKWPHVYRLEMPRPQYEPALSYILDVVCSWICFEITRRRRYDEWVYVFGKLV